jgi:hypothetical protein
MSMTPPFDPLLLLLDDPALLAALLVRSDPALAAPVVGAMADPPGPAVATGTAWPTASTAEQILPAREPDPRPAVLAAEPAPPIAVVPEDAFPSLAELDAMLAESYAPTPGPDAALRAELAAVLGLDPTLVDDEEAFLAALAALEPPPADGLPDPFSDAPSWTAAVPEDWALG